jgi:eukaryotic-like serine/threonine-protein kinase
LLAEDGRVVLTDFGLATFDGDGTVTRSGIILGSAQYISPERAREGSSGPEADMWSLGATLYAAVEGRSPFARETSMATLTALATEPPDPPKRAGVLRPVLIGLLRKNPRQRMRADEAEKLLRRVIETNGKGPAGRKAGRIPVQRGLGVPVETSNGAPANAASTSTEPKAMATAAATAAGSGERFEERGGEAGPGLRTVTEETFRQVAPPKGRWVLVWGLIAVVAALVTPAVILLVDARDPGQALAPSSPGGSSPAPELLTAAMRVQACADHVPSSETPVPPASAEDTDRYGLPLNWARYSSSGFVIDVVSGWQVSVIGDLTCFRDPTSSKAVAVFSHGKLDGNPLDLVRNTAAWQAAADMKDFKQLGLTDRQYPEGAADLEYTYQRGNIKMHGVNRMLRAGGRVYTIYFVTTDASWPTDRAMVDVIQPSFALAD